VRQEFFRTVVSPYEDGEELVAMPAIKLDAALIHVHRADARGNVLTLSPDPFFDELMARAADDVYVSTEELVSTAELGLPANGRYNIFERSLVRGVVLSPFGAHPTSAAPDYQLDSAHLATYVESAASPEAWAAYQTRFVQVEEEKYVEAVGGAAHLRALPVPVY
jgi:glutaconate CoA-transferase subunit A